MDAFASYEPVFWYRPRSDGGIEGPILNSLLDEVRKASGAWVPLFAGQPPDNVVELQAEIDDMDARLRIANAEIRRLRVANAKAGKV